MKTAPVSAGIEYANARIRGARSRLLDASTLDAYLGEPDFESFLRRLGDGPYGPYLEDARLTRTGLDAVGEAFRAALSDAYAFVAGLLGGGYRENFVTYAGRWDVQDLKTIVRGKLAGASPQEILSSLVGMGAVMPRSDLELLAEQADVGAVVSLAMTLGMSYASALSTGYATYQVKEALSDFELELDRAYLDWAFGRLRSSSQGGRMVREMLRSDVDVTNAVTAARVVDAGRTVDEVERYHLSGGEGIDLKAFMKLTTSRDVPELLERLGSTPLRGSVPAAQEAYVLHGTVGAVERALRMRIVRKVLAEGSSDVLGFGVPLAYVLSKEIEIANLRIIAHGKLHGIPAESLEKEIVRV